MTILNKKRGIVAGILLCIIIIIIIFFVFKSKKTPAVQKRTITPYYGVIKTYVSTTGTIQPENRLEIKPSINGRVEKILVREGDRVKSGQILIWMSSSERAALIDAARAQGGSELKYWEEVYKPIPLIAPITGTVIVRAMEPGQTATTASPILVLSDRLIVKANVDETDIGRVKEGQAAEISLDAYPEVKANGRVILIKYESTIINNVTTYAVDIVPDKVPAVFKSGMSANINIIDNIKKKALLIPNEAIISENDQEYVLIADRNKKDKKRLIKTGLTDEQNTEIISGLTEKENIVIIQKQFFSPDKSKNSSPFMPSRRKK